MSAIETETEKRAAHPLLETWPQNERMRHIPALAWIVKKLDVELRRRIELAYESYRSLSYDDPRHAPMEHELRLICRAIERLGEAAKHLRHNGQAPNDLLNKIGWMINHTVQSLNTVDANLFGRRFPVQTHERSKGEPVYGALLAVMHHVERLVILARAIDPGLDEKLLQGLVVLEHPVDEQTAKPIA
jgi:hypothetical protein